MLAALLLIVVVGGLAPTARVWEQRLSVEVTVSPCVQKGRISPDVFGAGIDHKTNPLRYPKYPKKVLRDIGKSGLQNCPVSRRIRLQPQRISWLVGQLLLAGSHREKAEPPSD